MSAVRTALANPIGSLRLAMRTLWLFAALAICLPLHGLWRLAGRPSPWSRRFLAWAARACGARVSTTGTPLARDVFFVANHLSWIDIPILGGVTGTAFVSQDKIRDWPIIGWLAQLNHTVFVSRTDRLAVAGQVEELRAALAEHQPIAIFPEGTTTDGRSLLPFKPPLFQVLLPPPRALRIQPVVLDFDDAGKALAWIGEETAPQNGWRVFTRPGSFHVRVHFLEPFDPGDHPDRKAISARARAAIAAGLSATLGGAPVP
ncbi:MAG: lysophospholipid acyltransferase family protein [Polymorphobacter sp.]